MNIAKFNERITFEKNSAVIDDVGNHFNKWTDYFTCSAYAGSSSYQQKESETAGVVETDDALVFTVRYCSELDGLDSTHYRVRFRGTEYNITSVDMMNYDKKSIKVSCSKERRQNNVE